MTCSSFSFSSSESSESSARNSASTTASSVDVSDSSMDESSSTLRLEPDENSASDILFLFFFLSFFFLFSLAVWLVSPAFSGSQDVSGPAGCVRE